MRKHGYALAAAAALTFSTGSAQVLAETPASSPATPEAPALAQWAAFLDSLKDLPSRVFEKLPEAQRRDPQVQQEVLQLVLGGLTTSGISALGSDVDHPLFLPGTGMIFGVGQPNADTIYKSASVDPGGTYRLRGKRGTLRLANLAQHGPTPGDQAGGAGKASPSRANLDLNGLRIDADGQFDLIVSPERPAGYSGDWWKLEPGTARIMLRQVSADWAKEEDPTIAIERLDKPANRPRATSGELAQRLRRMSAASNFIAPLLVGDPEQLRREGYVNKLREHNLDRGLLPGQFYYYGRYELGNDEALIVETKVPGRCVYWSTILTNHLYITTDWYNNHSSLNDAQAHVAKDGILRIIVSAQDPGVPNWLDTAGYPQGLIQGRWNGCDEKPVPSVRKVRFADVREALPPDTPRVSSEERQRAIRERRAAFQQRRLW